MAYKILIIFLSFGFAAFTCTSFFFLRKRRDGATGPRADELAVILPNANCGACGNPVCRELADKIIKGKSAIDACVSGGSPTAIRVARFLGLKEDGQKNRIK